MESIQGVEIAKVLDYVMINSPFYKKRFKDFRNLFSEGFDLEKFNKYQHTTYLIKNKLRKQKNIHLHNIARQLNSITGTIFILNFDKIK